MTFGAAHTKLLNDIKAQFGFDPFTSKRAAEILGRGRSLVRSYLCALIKVGAVERVEEGVFVVIRQDAQRHINPSAPVKTTEPVKAPDLVEAAICALKAQKVDVTREGDLFVLDGRQRVPLEVFLLVAEKRHQLRSHPVDFRSAKIAKLFAEMPALSTARRAGGR
jgi:predicted transcriptional regulator of viral defense system